MSFISLKKKNKGISFFVSIGAGMNQLPLIHEAKNLGFHVIGVDKNAVAPGFQHCDLKIQESIDNFKDIYTKLREMLVDGDIAGVMTKSYGVAIKTTSFLTEKFGIPFLPFAMSENFIDKKRMKGIFKDSNILSPRSFFLNQRESMSPLYKHLPLVMKPRVGHAKMDVRIVETREILDSLLEEKKVDPASMIFEQYVKGDEIIAIGIVHKKKYHLVEITDKKTTELPYFVDLIHSAPSRFDSMDGRVSAIGQSIADAFSIETSPLVMEFIVDSAGDLYLMEAVPEFGGEFLPDILIPTRLRYNMIGETVCAMTGREFREPLRKKLRDAVVVRYIAGTRGKLASCTPRGPEKVPGVVFSRIFKEIGSDVQEPMMNHDRIGVVVAKGKSVEEALKSADLAAAEFNIKIK